MDEQNRPRNGGNSRSKLMQKKKKKRLEPKAHLRKACRRGGGIFKVDIEHHLRRSHHAVSGCSLGELCDACLRGASVAEGLAALWCECQLLLGCTSQALAR